MNKNFIEDISTHFHIDPETDGYEALLKALDSDEGRRILSDQMDEVLEYCEGQACTERTREAQEEVLHRIERRQKRAWWRRMVLFAASAAAMIAIALGCVWMFVGQGTNAPAEFDEIVVAKGERPVHVVFQEGTHVIINAGSTLRYPRTFSSDNRMVSLTGEAYFKVSHNPKIPFVVNMGQTLVQVTGTKFNTRNYDDDSLTVVTLEEGAVNVVYREHELKLKPAQTAVCNLANGNAHVENRGMHGTRETLWKDNVIAFDKAPLADVIKSLNRWYDVEFDVKDRDVLRYSYTFTSAYMPLDSLLHDLENISFVEFRHNGDIIEVYSKK